MAKRAETRRLRRYRLQRDESAAEGLRRVARGQIDLSVELLERDESAALEEAIHESRKAFKRLRALLRLARDSLGDETYHRENETFRDVGRTLSRVRDARVMAGTLEDLILGAGDEISPSDFAGLRRALTAEAKAAVEEIANDAATIRDVLGALRAARVRVDGWPLPEDEGLRALAPGFERIYRRGRHAQRAAAGQASIEALHELRKRTKDLWHAAQLLRPAAPKRMKKLSREAHGLSDLVGEDHDLAVLLDGARERTGTLRAGELELLEALVARRRRELQREALPHARRLYRRKPHKVSSTVVATEG